MSGMQRIPPQDVDAEKFVLGCCLLNEEAVDIALEKIRENVFYVRGHAVIFQAIVSLSAASDPVDLVRVVGKLSDDNNLEMVGGAVYLAELTNVIPMPSAVPSYCERLTDKHILRGMIRHCGEVIERCYSNAVSSEVTDFAESGMFDLVSRHAGGLHTIGDLVEKTLDLIRERSERKGDVTGIPTGLVDLDRKLAGLHGGDMIIVAARPSMGKTAFAMNVVKGIAVDHGLPVLVFSLEMPGQQLAERMLSGCGEVDGQSLRSGMLSYGDWPKLNAAAGKLTESKIFIDEQSGLSIVDVRARARRAKSKFDIGVVVIDYLQLMSGTDKKNHDRQNQIAEISRGLKSIAKELDIPVIALSQLNRSLESRTDKRPMLSDLRESGSLEQDADVIMFIYRDDYYHKDSPHVGMAELIIGKQRSGPVGMVKLVFNKEISTFRSATDAY